MFRPILSLFATSARTAILATTLATTLASCNTTQEKKTPLSAKAEFESAVQKENDKLFDVALAHYARVKNHFPYSKYAKMSQLKIAHIHFEERSYVESESAYKLFKELYSKDASMDLVTFRIALSIYHQAPRSTDRDISLIKEALTFFKKTAKAYPKSSYAAEARNYETKCLRKLVQKDTSIGQFYLTRKKYLSAFNRFEKIFKTYPPTVGVTAQTLYGASLSAHHLSKKTKAKKYYKALLKDFPQSVWAQKIKNEVGGTL